MQKVKRQKTIDYDVYIASDGKEFKVETLCKEYETRLNLKQYLGDIFFVSNLEGLHDMPIMFVKDKNSFMAFANYANEYYHADFYNFVFDDKYSPTFDNQWVYAEYSDYGDRSKLDFHLLSELRSEYEDEYWRKFNTISQINNILKSK